MSYNSLSKASCSLFNADIKATEFSLSLSFRLLEVTFSISLWREDSSWRTCTCDEDFDYVKVLQIDLQTHHLTFSSLRAWFSLFNFLRFSFSFFSGESISTSVFRNNTVGVWDVFVDEDSVEIAPAFMASVKYIFVRIMPRSDTLHFRLTYLLFSATIPTWWQATSRRNQWESPIGGYTQVMNINNTHISIQYAPLL